MSAQSHLEFFLTSCPTSGARLFRGYIKIEFTVDEGKGRLNPSRDRNLGKHHRRKVEKSCVIMTCVFVCFLDIKIVGRTSRGHTGGRLHRISHPPSFCGACLNFSREKDSAIPFPRRP